MSTTNELDFQEFPRVSVETKIPNCESILSPTVLNTVSVAIQSPLLFDQSLVFYMASLQDFHGFPILGSQQRPLRLRKLWVWERRPNLGRRRQIRCWIVDSFWHFFLTLNHKSCQIKIPPKMVELRQKFPVLLLICKIPPRNWEAVRLTPATFFWIGHKGGLVVMNPGALWEMCSSVWISPPSVLVGFIDFL